MLLSQPPQLVTIELPVQAGRKESLVTQTMLCMLGVRPGIMCIFVVENGQSQLIDIAGWP
jgi:hypothetical protein